MTNNINNNKNIEPYQPDLTDHLNVPEKNTLFENLPSEIIVIILSYLSDTDKEISQLDLVSKKWSQLAPLVKNLVQIKKINQHKLNIIDAFPGLTAYEAMDLLLKNPYNQQLNYLDFSDFEDFNDDLLKKIIDNFPNLNTLKLMYLLDQITIIGVRYLAESKNLKVLKHLWLDGTVIRDEGAIVLGKSGALKNLITLHLPNCGIRDEGIKAIIAGNLKNLEILQLGVNGVGDEGLKAIAAGDLKNLKILGLAENLRDHVDHVRSLISIEGVKHLSASKSLNLTELDLRSNYIGDSKNHIGDEVAKVIASGGALKNLTHLNLTGNGVDDEGEKYLKTLKFLKVLYLGEYKIEGSRVVHLNKLKVYHEKEKNETT